MSGVAQLLMALMAGERLRTAITAGTDGADTVGYNQGSGYGSIGDATFTDAAGNSRTIRVVIWDGTAVQFWLDGGSVPNTAATFSRVVLSGPGGTVALLRSAATYNGAASGGTLSSWVWTSAAAPGSSSQNVTLVVS